MKDVSEQDNMRSGAGQHISHTHTHTHTHTYFNHKSILGKLFFNNNSQRCHRNT
jgi:hypothetical protein